MPAMMCRNFPSTAGACRASFIRPSIERLGPCAIRTGCRLGAFTQDEGGVTAYFFDRSGAHAHTVRGDILIGADGIHSKVRQTLFPD